MAEGSFVPLFMGNDGTGPYAVSGQAGNGPLPVTFGAPPTGLDVNALNQFKGADGLTYDVKAATNGDGPLPVILANALGPLATDSLTQFKGTDNATYNVKGAPGDGPLPVQLAAGGAPAPVHIDPAQLPLPVHLDPTQLPIPVTLPGPPATYTAVFFIPATVTGNLTYAGLSGSATKIVRVRRVTVTAASATGPSSCSYGLVRSVTPIAGGTVVPSTSLDTTNPAPTAVAQSYPASAIPADFKQLGSLFALVGSNDVTPTELSVEPATGGQAVTLRGINEFMYFNTNIALGIPLSIAFTYTEE